MEAGTGCQVRPRARGGHPAALGSPQQLQGQKPTFPQGEDQRARVRLLELPRENKPASTHRRLVTAQLHFAREPVKRAGRRCQTRPLIAVSRPPNLVLVHASCGTTAGGVGSTGVSGPGVPL